MIMGAAFDLDGLLADTEPLQFEAFRQTFSEYEIDLTKAEFIKRWIVERTETQGMMLDYKIEETIEAVRERKHQIYNDLKKEIKPCPGAVELVHELNSVMKIAVVSHGYLCDVEDTLKKIGLYDIFNGRIVAKENVLNFKPRPDAYIQGARRMSLDTTGCIAFEDAPAGVISAKRAGMYCVAVPNEYTASLDFSEADLVLRSLEEINYNFIKKIVVLREDKNVRS